MNQSFPYYWDRRQTASITHDGIANARVDHATGDIIADRFRYTTFSSVAPDGQLTITVSQDYIATEVVICGVTLQVT